MWVLFSVSIFVASEFVVGSTITGSAVSSFVLYCRKFGDSMPFSRLKMGFVDFAIMVCY
ncbi:26021_t:CDS:2 [Dentiscutata erythropus]|uniref:26021_t:CDS:1 n=1 Tax=Dentiscutata erythropus TaxID=1348616 RepID=A0A9N9B3G5_9GLOM|nr:26021_t:CDS:2 [Dentiscutata erythropus]